MIEACLLRDRRSCPAEDAQPAGLMRRCAGTTLRFMTPIPKRSLPQAEFIVKNLQQTPGLSGDMARVLALVH
jgi:hypothetical protein